MTKKELSTKIKEHKKEILIGTAITIGTVALAYLGIKKIENSSVKGIVAKLPDLASNNIDVSLDSATVTEAWLEGEWTNLILNDFKTKDIGILGEELVKNVPGFNEDAVLTCIIATTSVTE